MTGRIWAYGFATFILMLGVFLVEAAAQPRIEIVVAQVDAAEPVFVHARDACERWDVPDVPARAFRDHDGIVHLIASHTTTRRMSGSDLNRVRPSCAVLLDSRRDGDPAHYDDRSWLAALHTSDGQRVHALLHDEFHGHLRRDLCRFDRYMACWRNTITAGFSSDGGRSFRVADLPGRLVAGLPYRYDGAVGRHTGYFNPSNIVEAGGFFYAFFWAEPHDAQERGACLMRTASLADSAAWRGYDGKSFAVRFVDPYINAPEDPTRHVCPPVARGRLVSTVWSVVRHETSGNWLAVLAMTRPTSPGSLPVSGIWVATSRDLLDWSPAELVMAAPLLTSPSCESAYSYFYPALLDPASQSRVFESVGDGPFIYLTRLHMARCLPTAARDLVRIRAQIRPRAP